MPRTFLAAVAALAGLVVTGLYLDAPDWAQQARGTDLATLFLAVPSLAAGLRMEVWCQSAPRRNRSSAIAARSLALNRSTQTV